MCYEYKTKKLVGDTYTFLNNNFAKVEGKPIWIDSSGTKYEVDTFWNKESLKFDRDGFTVTIWR
jgi:hypothetical protein